MARAYAAKYPDTLVVTTADHGHTSQIALLVATPPGLFSTPPWPPTRASS